MQHISVMYFYPGGVSNGVIFEDDTDKDIFNMAMTASTVEEGNGNGKIKHRERPEVDAKSSRKTRNRR